jgi:hypothetical protein
VAARQKKQKAILHGRYKQKNGWMGYKKGDPCLLFKHPCIFKKYFSGMAAKIILKMPECLKRRYVFVYHSEQSFGLAVREESPGGFLNKHLK